MEFVSTVQISTRFDEKPWTPPSIGVSPKVVSEQLGHTSAAFTLDVYSHVLPHMQDDAAAKVEAALLGS